MSYFQKPHGQYTQIIKQLIYSRSYDGMVALASFINEVECNSLKYQYFSWVISTKVTGDYQTTRQSCLASCSPLESPVSFNVSPSAKFTT